MAVKHAEAFLAVDVDDGQLDTGFQGLGADAAASVVTGPDADAVRHHIEIEPRTRCEARLGQPGHVQPDPGGHHGGCRFF